MSRSLGVGLLVVVALGALLVGLRVARAGVLPRTSVGGVEVGGMDRAQLEQAVARLAERRAAERITATRGDAAVRATNADVGYELDVGATVEAAWNRGRQTNPIRALADHLRAFNGPTLVGPTQTISADDFDRWVRTVGRRLRRPVTEASVGFEGAEVVRTEAQPGARVAMRPLRAATRRAVLTPGDDSVAVETRPIRPRTDPEAIDAIVAEAELAVSAPVRLTRGDAALQFEPEQLGAMLSVTETADGFELTVDSDVLEEQLPAGEVAAVESEAVDADIAIVDGAPLVSPSQRGFRFDAQDAADQVAALVARRGDGRTAELDGEAVRPDLTTREVKDLGITEVVSSFTTEHACCESRVTNIQRFADLVDGALVLPGETFSLNSHVGERTVEKGFVGGGAIYNGEYVEQVGGGVSQFATTFFNAAWFGGYEILDHKPHSYYISRYPMGRESTINYPNVDVEIRNDSPYGLLITTSYTDTSITVTFWGTKWVRVETISGEPHNYTAPQTIYQENDALAPGEERVVQEGSGQGFDIVVTRVLEYPDGRTEREEYFTRYFAQARIVERNTS